MKQNCQANKPKKKGEIAKADSVSFSGCCFQDGEGSKMKMNRLSFRASVGFFFIVSSSEKSS